MSGHSKFANIAHKKAANDAAKGKIFTRLGKEIMVAVKEGGPEVNNNSKVMVRMGRLLLLKPLQITETEQLPTSVTHLQRAAEMSEHRAVYPLCLTIRDRLSLGKKTVIKMPMN